MAVAFTKAYRLSVISVTGGGGGGGGDATEATLSTVAKESTLSGISAKTPPLGAALAAASTPVALATDQIGTLATKADQALQTALLATLSGHTPPVGIALASASTPVALATDQIGTLATATNQLVQISAINSLTGAQAASATSARQDTQTTALGLIAANQAGAATAVKQDAQTTALGNLLTGQGVQATAANQTAQTAQFAAMLTNQTTQQVALDAISAKTPPVGAALAAASTPVALATDQINTLATAARQDAQTTALGTLVTNTAVLANQATAANQTTEIAAVNAVAAKLPVLGATVTQSASLPVVTPLPLLIDLTTAAGAAINAVLTPGAWLDVQAYRSAGLQLVTTGAAGGVIAFEQTNDTALAGAPLQVEDATLTATTVTTLSLQANTTRAFNITLVQRYFRIRVTTATTPSVRVLMLLNTAPAPTQRAGIITNTNFTLNAGNALASDVGIQARGQAAGGLTSVRVLQTTASTFTQLIKASNGRVNTIHLHNNGTIAVFVKLYNQTTAPTAGAGTPLAQFGIPPAQTMAFTSNVGIAFSTGIGLAITAGSADADTTALNAFQVNGTICIG